MMEISKFKKSYDNRTVLDFPGLKLVGSKVYAVIGANGSGKSTFGKILSGIEKCDSGEKKVLGKEFCVGYMPQKNFAFSMKTIDNLLINGEDEKKAESLLERIGLDKLKDENAKSLSGGETQKMALARLLMKKYDLLILDEPTAAMDVEATILAEKLILEYIKENNCPVILITHSITQALRVADTTIYLEQGNLIEMDDTEELVKNPKDERTRKFIEFYGA